MELNYFVIFNTSSTRRMITKASPMAHIPGIMLKFMFRWSPNICWNVLQLNIMPISFQAIVSWSCIMPLTLDMADLIFVQPSVASECSSIPIICLRCIRTTLRWIGMALIILLKMASAPKKVRHLPYIYLLYLCVPHRRFIEFRRYHICHRVHRSTSILALIWWPLNFSLKRTNTRWSWKAQQDELCKTIMIAKEDLLLTSEPVYLGFRIFIWSVVCKAII